VTSSAVPVCDQYAGQRDAFFRVVPENTEVPVSMEDAIKNMAVIEAIYHSANPGQWQSPQAIKGVSCSGKTTLSDWN
jgi:predicted dehydrogenase